MSNYSDDASSIRVDFFKPSGKWYTTEAVKWTGGYKDCCIHQAFRESLISHFGGTLSQRLSGMTAVCLEPYHEHTHPITMVVGENT